MNAQLSLMEPTPTPAQLSTRKDRWMRQLRAAVRRRHRGETITADQVHAIIDEHPELRIPDGMSPNVMGSFFSTWACAERTDGFRRSKREGTHGNPLIAWRIL